MQRKKTPNKKEDKNGFFLEIESAILNNPKISKLELSKLKVRLCSRFGLRKIPSDIEIMLNLSDGALKRIKSALIMKPTRTASGVAVCAVMTPPSKCPHGKCLMCPGGLESFFGDVPQSYTGHEPATKRAIRNDYDPYLQVFNRLEQYSLMGHNFGKVELIIMGGTFPAQPKAFQNQFVAYTLKALNDFSHQFFRKGIFNIKKFKKFFIFPCEKSDSNRATILKAKILALKKPNGEVNLLKEQKRNEKSNIRCVGLTIETRPDYGFFEHGKEMLKLGCTRIELGVQTTSDISLKAMERGHTVDDSIRSIRELKDLGFKLNFHIMPGLIGSSKKKDIEMIKELFKNPNFRPDMLKIYPCMVTKGTKLYELYLKGKYKPLSTKDACEIITKIYPEIPYYCRIMRIQRDIPTQNIVAGVDMTNLRQYIFESLKKEGTFSSIKEIRHREAGRIKSDLPTKLFIEKYNASKGTEFFISLESIDRKVLYGFCRLRLPYKNLALEYIEACEKKSIDPLARNVYAKNVCDKKIALVRELHVYGTAINIGDFGEVQHKGYGKQLLEKAEELAKENATEKILVISGIGVREYYKRLGYRKYRTYMVKKLR